MIGNDYPDDQRPITYWNGVAIYGTTLLIGIYIASMLLTTLLQATGNGNMMLLMTFSSEAVLRRGWIWQWVTYVFVNPPSIGFAIDMLMLWWFGRPLEQFFGRAVFLRFYLLLVLLVPVLFTILGTFHPMSAAGVAGRLAVFVAFATLYPNAALLFNILAKWAAAVIVGVQALIFLSGNDWNELIALLVTCGFAFAFVRYERGLLTLPKLALFNRRPKFRIVRPAEESRRESPREVSAIDPLLEKIARSGMESLTTDEKALLQRAREALLKKDRE